MNKVLAQKSRTRKQQQDHSEQAKREPLSEGRSEGAAAGMPLYLQGSQAPLASVPMASHAPTEQAPAGARSRPSRVGEMSSLSMSHRHRASRWHTN